MAGTKIFCYLETLEILAQIILSRSMEWLDRGFYFIRYWIYWSLMHTAQNYKQLQRHRSSPRFTNHHNSPKVFSSLLSSPVFQWQRLIRMEILQLYALNSSLNGDSLQTAVFPHILTYRTNSVTLFTFLINPLRGPSTKHRFQQYLYFCILIRDGWNMFNEPLPRNEYCFNAASLTAAVSLPPKFLLWANMPKYVYVTKIHNLLAYVACK
jgi:hypothetical protein